MTRARTDRPLHLLAAAALLMIAAAGCSPDSSVTPPPTTQPPPVPPPPASVACAPGNGGITLPPGFCASIFADGIGRPRHMAVSAAGDLYVLISGGGVLALRDTSGDGRADVSGAFGRNGVSGLALRGNDLFMDVGSAILRYRLAAGSLAAASGPDTLVRGLPTGGHGTRSIAVDAAGNLFVNVGSTGNACEGMTRDPCSDLQTRAGIWRFRTDEVGQSFTAASRYATGIRNAVAVTVQPGTSRLWAAQHGRDNLFTSFPALFTAQDGAENPAEELFQVNEGDDFGWPYCYYDFRTNARVLAPDYGGNRQATGRCATTKPPVAVFPGHWAPNGIVFYDGASFPARYRGGAFVAFHGSHNRTPLAQAGYLIAFVPPAGTGLASTHEVFADGFAGSTGITAPSQAAHRPTGLAVDASGALYIGDDWRGRIWRVVYRGP
jgi:glucose/arabinose dehydrogenase